MPKKKKGQTRRQRKKQRRKELANQPEALDLADNPMADVDAEFDDTTPFDEWLEKNEIDDDELVEIISEEISEDVEEIEEVAEEIVEEIIEAVEEKESIRLTDYVQYKTPEEVPWVPSEKDIEDAETEMWASFVDVNLLEKVITKAKLSSAARDALPDSAFACVKDGKRSLPIHDKAHVRNALARLPQMIKKGGESAEVARCGRKKVIAAAKKMGIGLAGKERTNGILVEKDTDGDYRWTGFVSNNFKDREGEIISEAAHKEFVSYLDANPERAPEFWTWHTRGTARASKVDAWLYHEGFLIMSGPLTDTEAYRLMKAISSDDIGMSHGFFALKQDNIITKYRAYEVSDLPLRKAANTWTSIETHLKEVSSMSEKIEYLKKLTSDEFVEGLLEQAEENKDFLVELGIESKEVDEPEAETEEVVEDSDELTKKQKKVIEEVFGQDVSEIKQYMEMTAKVVPAMAKEIDSLKEKLAKTEEEAEETLADMIGNTAASKAQTLKSRPSESTKNIQEDDKELDEPHLKEHDPDDWWGVKIEREEA